MADPHGRAVVIRSRRGGVLTEELNWRLESFRWDCALALCIGGLNIHSVSTRSVCLGRLAQLLIIARKQHTAGRGLTAATTSPTPLLTNPVGIPFTGAIQLPPAPIPSAPLPTAHYVPPITGSSALVQTLPASLGVIPTDAPAAGNGSIIAAPPATSAIAATPMLQSGLGASSDVLLDAQSLQAQVEALIQSTSSSVAATNTVDPTPIATNQPLAELGSVPSIDVSQSAIIDVLRPIGTSVAPTVLPAPALLPALSSAGDPSLPALTAGNRPACIESVIAAGPSFQNTFAQYQYPQNYDRALRDAGLVPSGTPTTTAPKQEPDTAATMTTEEEERAADALIADHDAQDTTDTSTRAVKSEPFSGADLAAAAKAIGIDADADLLSGTIEDQRALVAAIRRLGGEHGQAAQKAVQEAAAAAAAAAAARASQELARVAARGQASTSAANAGTSSVVDPSRSKSTASPSGKSGKGSAKRFPCPKCDKAFARAFNLNTHLSTHDPDPNRAKPYTCPYPSCKSEGGRSFSRKHDLQRHVASIHEKDPEPGIHGDPEEVLDGDTGGLVSLGLGTPGKKFRCYGCGRSFVRRDACNRHQCDGNGSPSSRMSRSPSGTPYASSMSPRSSALPGMRAGSGTPVGLGGVRSRLGSPVYDRVGLPVALTPVGGNKPSNSLSKEVQAVAKQLQARVEAQSPGSQASSGGATTHSRNIAPSSGSGERRNFPLSAISLYASTGPSNTHSRDKSPSGGTKVPVCK